MEKAQFLAWREWMRWSQADAAAMLGISKRTVQLYEAGTQAVPKAVELACYALALGVRAYPGPEPR